MDIQDAESDEDLDEVRRLCRSFLTWHRERHTGDAHLIDAYFDEAAWERELAGLPGSYGPPDGSLLLAREAELALGCVGAKRLDLESCEMKRMFVAPIARGRGVGRALAEHLLDRVRAAGYRRMYLDTSIRQEEALALYRDLGFVEVAPYYDVPEELRDWLVFLRLEL
ncbi:MAG: GNAT family N-acetyltransferase [Nocardioides sp.]